MSQENINGQQLHEMLAASMAWLEKCAPEIDAINVFPVPDGDTGTNMLGTMRSIMEEADKVHSTRVDDVANAMSHGALMGARGNSGVILSQIFRGLATVLGKLETASASDWANALDSAAQTAYKGISKPVEGTILTVVRDAAEAAKEASEVKDANLTSVMETTVEAAQKSVGQTPLLLPALKEAGVVDAGGQGLYVILEGALHFLKGDMEEIKYRRPHLVASSSPITPGVSQLVATEQEEPYGYCTEFLLTGHELNVDRIRKSVERRGQSVVVVGDEGVVKVHVHTLDPGSVLHYAAGLGKLHKLKIENMDDMHVGFIEMQKDRLPTMEMAMVAVAAGDGLKDLLISLGVTKVVSGGQTMNPSVRDILQAVESAPSNNVLVLPNNKNIVLTANQVQGLTNKKVMVVPSRTIPQGVAALLAFNFEGSIEDNARVMEQAMARVKTIEITRAVRTTKYNGIRIRRGQYIAIVNDETIVTAGEDAVAVLMNALSKVGADSASMITVYYGADVKIADGEAAMEEIRSHYPQPQSELVIGGQPHYQYIVAVEA
jgi:DAK2 domain fusion protein YloV